MRWTVCCSSSSQSPTQEVASDMKFTKVQYRMVDVYHGGLFSTDQERIVKQFMKEESNFRLLISTIAFGMGVDSK